MKIELEPREVASVDLEDTHLQEAHLEEAHLEEARLEAVKRSKLLDVAADPDLERFARLIAAYFDAPIALVTLVDRERQFFACKIGLEGRETPREHSFCAHTIQQGPPLVVPDASKDPRFAENPLVTGSPKIRFYAGATIVSSDGFKLGSLCVIDTKPREVSTASELEFLTEMAAAVSTQIEGHRRSEMALEAEGRERKLRQEHKSVLSAIPDMVFRLNLEGRILEAHGDRDQFLIPPEQFLGMRVAELMSPEIGELASKAIREVQLDGQVRHFEYEVDQKFFEARVAANGPDEVIVIARDRSEQHLLTVRLQHDHDFLLEITEAMGQGLIVRNPANQLEYVNPAFAQMMQLEPHELLNRSKADPNAFAEFSPDPTTSSLGVQQREIRLRRNSGQTVAVLISDVPRWDGDDFLGWITVITDLSELKRLETSLQRERDLMNSIMEATEMLFVVTDTEGNIRQMNRAAQETSGMTLAELRGQPIKNLLPTPSQNDGITFELNDLLGAPRQLDLPLATKAGGTRWVTWSNAVIKDNKNRPKYLVATGVDITERRNAERQATDARLEAEQAVLRAERASRTKSAFFAGISHELRTPLHAVVGYSDLLLDDQFSSLDGEQKDHLNEIRAASNHLLALINDLLDISKIEAGHVQIEPERIVIRDAFDACFGLLRSEAEQRQIRLEAQIEPDLEHLIAGDRQFKQIVLNLLSNAVKFSSPGGTVRIAASRHGHATEIVVEDHGIGIGAEHLPTIFEPFAQVRASNRRGEGFGLGLALVQRLVKLHGGQIRASSELGQGSQFRVTFPDQV